MVLDKLCPTSHPSFKMDVITKNRSFFNYLLLLYFKSKWAQVITEAMIHSTYITGIYSDYGYFENRNHIKICKETWTEMIFCYPLSKLWFTPNPPFSSMHMAAITISRNFKWLKKKRNQLQLFKINFRCEIENQLSHYKLQGTSCFFVNG